MAPTQPLLLLLLVSFVLTSPVYILAKSACENSGTPVCMCRGDNTSRNPCGLYGVYCTTQYSSGCCYAGSQGDTIYCQNDNPPNLANILVQVCAKTCVAGIDEKCKTCNSDNSACLECNDGYTYDSVLQICCGSGSNNNGGGGGSGDKGGMNGWIISIVVVSVVGALLAIGTYLCVGRNSAPADYRKIAAQSFSQPSTYVPPSVSGLPNDQL
eukprot:gnl/Hemi2/11122_TR3834_c0_g1_i1.p1 gnl/Hemi2/11122_TR3834_c0_g1~~gnl/Hemi2/11122_TR3834_c0_g1_i1.p1  ORF type:complete len:212 (-),score=48.57 gnl/Hemi2/11122_TR3834_c0_g1_i1:48-683(-)